MVRRVIQAFPLLLVVMVVAVKCDVPNVLTEVLEAINVNQMALLQEMNASSSTCASRV